jgi:hypothetical protein
MLRGLSLSMALAAALTMGMAPSAGAASSRVAPLMGEPVIWNGSAKSMTWIEELLGQVVTYQTLAEKQVVPGNYQPYLDQMMKVRDASRADDSRGTYHRVNEFMTMLEARVGGIDDHSAEALWDFCYRVTPDAYHARDRHVRAKGEKAVKKAEDFLRDMEERASLSF